MKKIHYLVLIVAILASCTTPKQKPSAYEDRLYEQLVQYVNEIDISALSNLLDNTTPANMKKVINRQDAAGRTVLHTAVVFECPEIVEKLLAAGADKMVMDNSKKTAADYVEDSRNEEIRLLFGFSKEKPVTPQAAEPKKTSQTQIVKPEKRVEPFSQKHKVSKTTIPSAIISQDMSLYNVALGYSNSEFLKAVKDQDYAAVSELLNRRKNVNETDINGNSALFYTLINGNTAIMKLLLSYGINPNYGNKAGQLPLLYAVSKGNLSSIQALLDVGANVNQEDSAGMSAVMIAVFHRNIALLKFLHMKGAYLNAKDSYGNTLLHIAINNEDIDATRYLLEKGCDVYEPNDTGIKPISLLKSSERAEFRNIAKKYEE